MGSNPDPCSASQELNHSLDTVYNGMYRADLYSTHVNGQAYYRTTRWPYELVSYKMQMLA